MESNKKYSSNKLKHASQAEILRSHQKDDDFVKYLREKFMDILQMFGKQKQFLHIVHSDIPIKLIYFLFTSGMLNQTLGEEYTGIVQANVQARKVPSLPARVTAALLECFGERTLLIILKRLQFFVNDPRSELTPTAVTFLNTFLSKMHSMIPIFIMVHKGLFYMYGRYYSLGKRISGVDYAKVYGHRPTDSVSWGLRLLGIATLAQCVLKVWQNNINDDHTDKCIPTNDKCITQMCQLCLERIPTTTTPCGHLFCWSCISDWLSTKPQCPLCREYVKPSRIVHVLNL